ncbi:hypothetical protein KAH94_06225 [bacterium]|nr:hypothetical protein [bacterium]
MSITKSVSFEDEVFDSIRKKQKKSGDGFSKTVNILLKEKTLSLDKKGNSKVILEKGENIVKNYNGKVYTLNQGQNCNQCGEWKPFSEYRKDNEKKSRHKAKCKSCMSIKNKK